MYINSMDSMVIDCTDCKLARVTTKTEFLYYK